MTHWRAFEVSRHLAATEDVDLLLFPERFLQGHLVERPPIEGSAMALNSSEFADILTSTAVYHADSDVRA